jgi:hypothetical protein
MNKVHRASKNYVEIEEFYDVSKRRFSQMDLSRHQLPNKDYENETESLDKKRNNEILVAICLIVVGTTAGTIGSTSLLSSDKTPHLATAMQGIGFTAAVMGVLIGANAIREHRNKTEELKRQKAPNQESAV